MPIETVDIETTDLYASLCWSSDRTTEAGLKAFVVKWLRDYPIRVNDIAIVVVVREIYLRIYTALDEPYHGSPSEIDYEQIVRQINRDTRITGALRTECLDTLDVAWQFIALILEGGFTKLDPVDD